MPGGPAPWNIAAGPALCPGQPGKGALHPHSSARLPRPGPEPSITSALTGQNAAAGPDGGRDGRGAPAPPPGGTVTPQSSLGWVGSWAGRGCPVTLCPLPTERPGRHGDHLAAAGPGRSVAGCGRGCAPSHGWLSCPAGHLRLCQGLGAGATGERPGTQTPRSEEATCLLSPSCRARVTPQPLQLDSHTGNPSRR